MFKPLIFGSIFNNWLLCSVHNVKANLSSPKMGVKDAMLRDALTFNFILLLMKTRIEHSMAKKQLKIGSAIIQVHGMFKIVMHLNRIGISSGLQILFEI